MPSHYTLNRWTFPSCLPSSPSHSLTTSSVYVVYVYTSQSVSLSHPCSTLMQKARCWEVLVILPEQILNSCAHGVISCHCLLGEQMAPEGVILSLFFSLSFHWLVLLLLHCHSPNMTQIWISKGDGEVIVVAMERKNKERKNNRIGEAWLMGLSPPLRWRAQEKSRDKRTKDRGW